MGNYINEALLDANHHKKLKDDSKHLVTKWEKTGLLEGLNKEYDKSGMSIMLENQAKQLIDEASATGTYSNSEEWSGVALPLVRRIFAEIAAQDFVSVQPMNLPSGLVFYLDFKFGTSLTGRATTESLYGKTGPYSPLDTASKQSSPFPEGGFYGAGKYDYTMPTGSLPIQAAEFTSVGGVSLSDVNYDSEWSASSANVGNYVKATFTLADFPTNTSGSDILTYRGWRVGGQTGTPLDKDKEVSGSAPQFTTFNSTTGVLTMILKSDVSDPIDASSVYTLQYFKQPTDISRGDFEANTSGLRGQDPEEANRQIPEINLDLKSRAIVAKTRKLKAVWTPELAQDLNAYHSVDAEAELTSMLSEYISMEIDLEILDMLISDATTTDYWSARVGYEWDGSNFVGTQHLSNALAYQKNTWYQTLGQTIQRVSNKIHQLTLRGGANFLVCSPDVSTIIESIPGYAADTDGTKDKYSMGVSQIGSLRSRWNVYKNPYMTENTILLGFRGSNFLETGAVYAPYVPLIMTPLVYDPSNFTPRKGVMTRYAKLMVRPEYYAKIYVHGLETV